MAQLSAWGTTGPWARRRGFDSLVQAATGIAVVEGTPERPGALPAQALDHGSGYLLAAGVLRALTEQSAEGGSRYVRVALARTAAWLTAGTGCTAAGEAGAGAGVVVRAGRGPGVARRAGLRDRAAALRPAPGVLRQRPRRLGPAAGGLGVGRPAVGVSAGVRDRQGAAGERRRAGSGPGSACRGRGVGRLGRGRGGVQGSYRGRMTARHPATAVTRGWPGAGGRNGARARARWPGACTRAECRTASCFP